MSLTNYAENAVLAHLYGVDPMPPVTPWVGLFTAAPSDSSGGTEASGNGYARVNVAWAQPGSNQAANGIRNLDPGQTTNTEAAVFTATGGPLGVPTHWGIFDAETGGNLIKYGILRDADGNPNAREYLNGDIMNIPPGMLTGTAD